MGIKEDIIEILVPIFGKDMGERINRIYAEEDSQELYDLAKELISGSLGSEKANSILKNFSKFAKG